MVHNAKKKKNKRERTESPQQLVSIFHENFVPDNMRSLNSGDIKCLLQSHKAIQMLSSNAKIYYSFCLENCTLKDFKSLMCFNTFTNTIYTVSIHTINEPERNFIFKRKIIMHRKCAVFTKTNKHKKNTHIHTLNWPLCNKKAQLNQRILI